MDDNFILELSTPLEEQVTNFQHVCSRIFSRNEFVDCTLCCADGQLQAHRVILACASNYMHNILSSTPWPTPCSHPLLFFKSFSLCDMKLAVEFIYTGKTQVSKNKLPTLMNIAREMGCSNLSKAIEKAIHSCGIEIFRKRIQTAEANKQGIATKRPITTATQRAANDKAGRQQIHELIPPESSEEEQNLVQSIDDGQDDESIFSNDIKVEPGENMTLELDPSSIVTTTLDDKTIQQTDAIQSPFSCSTEGNIENSLHTVNNRDDDLIVSASDQIGQEQSDQNRDTQNDMDCIITTRSKPPDNGRNFDQIQNVKLTVKTVPGNTIDNVDDYDDQLKMEDDEDTPITVVDLKSLAETGLETEAEMIAMSAIDNSETLPANCPWCFQVFTSLTLLQRHIKTHVGNYKPYSCQYCPASFARSAHLKRHIRTHTGEKPFVCTFCSRAFSRQDKLKTHLEKHLLDQQLQNGTKLSTLGSFPTSQTPTRSINIVKTSSPTSTGGNIAGLSPPKPLMPSLPNSPNFAQCVPSPSFQYFLNDSPDTWQSQADRISKGLIGIPGQTSTIVTTISPCTTATTASSLLIHSNPSSHL